jgi:hypothetical protein
MGMNSLIRREKHIGWRIVIPAAIVVIIMVVSINLYNYAPALSMNYPGLGRFAANISALGMFISIWLGVFIAHPLAFWAGASMKERFVVSFSTPVIWCAKLLMNTSCIYSGLDLTFWVFYPLIVGIIGTTLLNMGISEIICRQILSRKYPLSVKAMSPSVVIILLIGLITVPMTLMNGGTVYFYIFVDFYTMLFG